MMATKNFPMRIADFNVSVRFVHLNDESFQIPRQYWPFARKEEEAVGEPCLFTLDVDDNFSFEQYGTLIEKFNELGFGQGVYRLDDGSYQFELSDYDGILVCSMQTDPTFTRMRIALNGNEQQRAFGFNNAMMIAFAFSSAMHQTLLMHSSVTIYRGRGNLFLGKSGTGKSTHSSLWLNNFEGTELLNDDNPAVRIVDGRAIVYGTPWSGKTPCYKNLSAPVNAFVMLDQKPYNRIKRQETLQGLASLMTSCSSMIWDSRTYRAICNTMAALLAMAPVYFLECLPDLEAAQLSRSTLYPEP